MKIPLSLLKKFINIEEKSLDQITEALISLGIEVDEVLAKEQTFCNVVAAKVVEVKKHPESEKLLCLTLATKTEEHSVVSADLSIQKSMMVAFAPINAKVEGKTVQKRFVQKALSEGMLVSAKQLGIYEENSQVLRLDHTFSLGQDLACLHDPVFVIALTPNLGHCQSILGIARELCAYFALKPPVLEKASYEQHSLENVSDCQRYSSLVLNDIAQMQSPFWLRSSLEKAGFSSTFLMIDILHYVLLITGQPMHAFCLDSIKDNPLSVRRLKQDTPLDFLDGTTRVCPKNALGVYAQNTLVALAGIMGGKNFSVQEKTKNYWIEAAHFCPTMIRKTSNAMGLRSESSTRFEKGIDPNLGPDALGMVASIVRTITGSSQIQTIKSSHQDSKKRIITCRKSRVVKILGIEISLEKMEEIFTRLDCSTTREKKDSLSVKVPTYRNDLKEEIDLIEEIIRIHGFAKLQTHPLQGFFSLHPDDSFSLFCKKMRQTCLQLGFNQCITPDLISPNLALLAREDSFLRENFLTTIYAKSAEHSVLRSTILGSFLQVLSQQIAIKNTKMQGFEIGKVYCKKKDITVETSVLSFMTSGKKNEEFWENKSEEHNFYELKGACEQLLSFWKEVSFRISTHPSMHPTRQADIYLSDQDIGVIGEVHPQLLEKFSIKQKVFFTEIDLDTLWKKHPEPTKVESFSLYPSSNRDWTVILPKQYVFASLKIFLESLSSPILEKTALIDHFVHKTHNTTHFTIRFTYRSSKRTLSMEEVEKEHERLQAICAKQFATLK